MHDTTEQVILLIWSGLQLVTERPFGVFSTDWSSHVTAQVPKQHEAYEKSRV